MRIYIYIQRERERSTINTYTYIYIYIVYVYIYIYGYIYIYIYIYNWPWPCLGLAFPFLSFPCAFPRLSFLLSFAFACFASLAPEPRGQGQTGSSSASGSIESSILPSRGGNIWFRVQGPRSQGWTGSSSHYIICYYSIVQYSIVQYSIVQYSIVYDAILYKFVSQYAILYITAKDGRRRRPHNTRYKPRMDGVVVAIGIVDLMKLSAFESLNPMARSILYYVILYHIIVYMIAYYQQQY